MAQSREDIATLEESISSIQVTIDRVTNFPNKVRYDVMVPTGKVAFCPGQLIHTNEFKVLESNQTEVDLPAIEIISHKDTTSILQSRADDLQKKLAQLQLKYGIKQDISKSVTSSTSSLSVVPPPAPQRKAQFSSSSLPENEPTSTVSKPVGNSILEKEPSVPKPLKSVLKSSWNTPKQATLSSTVASNEKVISSSSKTASHHVTFNNTLSTDSDNLGLDSSTIVPTATTTNLSNSLLSSPVEAENIVEIREYIDDENETVRSHELIDVTKQLAHMEKMQKEKKDGNEEDEKKEEYVDPQAAMLDLLSPAPPVMTEEENFIRELSLISDRVAATKKQQRKEPTVIHAPTQHSPAAHDDLDDIFSMLEQAQSKNEVVVKENVAASKGITGKGWKSGFFGGGNGTKSKITTVPTATTAVPKQPVTTSIVEKTIEKEEGSIEEVNRDGNERKKGALLASLGYDTSKPKKSMKVVDAPVTTSTTSTPTVSSSSTASASAEPVKKKAFSGVVMERFP